MASAVMGASVAEVDCSGLCGCVIPMLAVKAVIFCGGVFCTRRFRALQDSRPLQFVKKSTKFDRLSNRHLYALNDNVDVLKELGHLHEKKPLSVAVIFVDAHQATIVHDSWRDLASAAAVSRVRKTSSEAPQPCRLQASAWSTSCYWLPAKIVS